QLTNTYLAVGPHNAFALGLEYQDPNFWRLSATYSYYTNTYLGISPILRTQNFLLDDDGLPFVEYDPEKAKMILIQERFADYGLLNLTANKSWKIEDMYLGWFLSINNILGTSYKTGGYEQSRSANYRSLLEDYEAPMRRFGPKYWYGRGTTFFMNLSLRF
ncbi:MAG: TonB-dependent receptor, partial [Flavobacteriaceae bacterium]|nr:TonB-dependent receptor [Flavobacteriaceae bacterium]